MAEVSAEHVKEMRHRLRERWAVQLQLLGWNPTNIQRLLAKIAKRNEPIWTYEKQRWSDGIPMGSASKALQLEHLSEEEDALAFQAVRVYNKKNGQWHRRQKGAGRPAGSAIIAGSPRNNYETCTFPPMGWQYEPGQDSSVRESLVEWRCKTLAARISIEEKKEPPKDQPKEATVKAPKKYKNKHKRYAYVPRPPRTDFKRVRCIETQVEYPSAKAAGELLGVTPAAIHSSIKTGYYCKGFHWEWALLTDLDLPLRH